MLVFLFGGKSMCENIIYFDDKIFISAVFVGKVKHHQFFLQKHEQML